RPEHQRRAGAPDHTRKNRVGPGRVADDGLEPLTRDEIGKRAPRTVNRVRAAHPDRAQGMDARSSRLELAREASVETQGRLGAKLARAAGPRERQEQRLDAAEQVAAINVKDSHLRLNVLNESRE